MEGRLERMRWDAVIMLLAAMFTSSRPAMPSLDHDSGDMLAQRVLSCARVVRTLMESQTGHKSAYGNHS